MSRQQSQPSLFGPESIHPRRRPANDYARGRTFVRLLEEMRQLQASRFGLSLAQLAREYGVTERTIRRDLIVLQAAGIPLIDDVHDGGTRRYRVLDRKVA